MFNNFCYNIGIELLQSSPSIVALSIEHHFGLRDSLDSCGVYVMSMTVYVPVWVFLKTVLP